MPLRLRGRHDAVTNWTAGRTNLGACFRCERGGIQVAHIGKSADHHDSAIRVPGIHRALTGTHQRRHKTPVRRYAPAAGHPIRSRKLSS